MSMFDNQYLAVLRALGALTAKCGGAVFLSGVYYIINRMASSGDWDRVPPRDHKGKSKV